MELIVNDPYTSHQREYLYFLWACLYLYQFTIHYMLTIIVQFYILGTMSVYTATRARILAYTNLSIQEVIQKARDDNQGDETLQKYIVRLKQKLKMPLQD